MTTNPTSLPNCTEESPYFQEVICSGIAPYSYSVSNGGLITGITIDKPEGEFSGDKLIISGTPTVDGVWASIITITDSDNNKVELDLDLKIN